MLQPSMDKSFYRFPYRANFEDGASNIGGIALFLEPERIDEIPELQPFPELKQSLLELNISSNPFVSLGIAIWQNAFDNGYSGGYIEIGCLDSEYTFTEAFMGLDEQFYAWLPVSGYTPEQAQYVKAALNCWEYHPTKILQNAESRRVAIWPMAQNNSDLAAVLKVIVDFFRSL